tara:strand:- start:218 stop:703 length:486 start_codon:yes stop_codon:yes gene_type:complete
MILKKAKLKDSKFFYNLRNNPQARKISLNTNYIKYPDHIRWFKNALKSNKFQLFKILFKEKIEVGYVRLNEIDGKIFVSINVNKKYRGKGIAYEALILVENQVTSKKQSIFSIVKNKNISSKKLFFKVGYEFNTKRQNYFIMKKKINTVIIKSFLNVFYNT